MYVYDIYLLHNILIVGSYMYLVIIYFIEKMNVMYVRTYIGMHVCIFVCMYIPFCLLRNLAYFGAGN